MSTDPNDDFRKRLVEAQEMTPALREGYRKELDALIHQTHTPRSRIGAVIMLVICVGVVVGEIWALSRYPGSATFYIGAGTMLLACAVTAAWIVRDLYRGRSLRRESFKVADLFYGAASILTVVTLMHGLSKPSDPASTFNALYVFVFLVVCAHWAFSNRIAAATLETREHLLRVESRLADLADRSQK
jgi:hypothetical protein